MTKRILLLALSIISIETYAQNAKLILQKSFSKCLTIKNGYYEMQKMMKFMDEKDIHVYGDYKFYFNKIKNDSLYTVAFNSKNSFNGEYFKNVMYTGNEYVTYSTKDSSAQIMGNERCAATIKRLSHNDIWNFYLPFTSEDCTPLPKASDYTDNKHIFKFIANEMQNNKLSFHVQMVEYPKYDSTDVMYVIKTVYDYWVNSKDMVPVKYSATSIVVNNGDTVTAYSSNSLIKYNLNSQSDKKLMPLQLSSIPKFCNIKDYVETKKIELLNKDANAPNWTLNSLEEENVSLTGYNGKLIVMDFFYKSCYPCMKAIPVLKMFYEKYKSKGLVVIGIDPIDKKNEGIETFISKHGIAYKVFLDEKGTVANQYNVSSYPTIYLIDKNGKIIYANSGYDEAFESTLEELIKNNL